MLRVGDYADYINNSKRPIFIVTKKAFYIVPKNRKCTVKNNNQFGSYLYINKATRLIFTGREKVKIINNLMLDELEIVHCQSLSENDMKKVFTGD